MPTRQLSCPETGDVCSDPGCSKKYCKTRTSSHLVRIVNDREASIDRQVELGEAKREISLEVLKVRKIAPTEGLIRKLTAHETVVAEAERRVSLRERSLQELKGRIDFKSIPIPKPRR